MIKQDYLIRMILEIVTLIANAILNKRKIQAQNWIEYDCLTQQILHVSSEKLIEMSPDEIIERYKDDPNEMGKTELAAMTLLKIADDTPNDQLLLKARLKGHGTDLLKYIQTHGDTFSIQRMALIQALENEF